MDLSRALAILWAEVDRSSQAAVAEDIGVAKSAVTNWKQGVEPKGDRRRRLFEWAERKEALRTVEYAPKAATPATVREYDAVVATVIASGENRARLGVVQGYAQFVLDQLIELARKQQAVVDGIRPFADAEGQALAANVPPEKIPELLDSIRRYQAQQGEPDGPEDHRRGIG